MPTVDSQDLDWNFDNSYARLPEHFFTRIAPEPVPNPKLILLNDRLACELGLTLNSPPEMLADIFSGNQLPKGAEPIAQAYAGHQFGSFAFLGDGRAHLIGEHIKPDGSRVDVQFKGSGQTPYGTRGDGRAALGPMLREYIISEAMHALGVPTTRSLSVVTTGQEVHRETTLAGAVLTRIAASHLRIGTFENLLAQNDLDGLKILADYAIARHYPDAQTAANPYQELLNRVINQQATLIVHWMRIGFIHGVMNTDNMTLSGETIDYGPCAFMDAYNPQTVFSAIDQHGRYNYENQPAIALWNITRFAEALLPLLDSDNNKAIELAKESINQFPVLYQDKWLAMMGAKLGLFSIQQGDYELIAQLLILMHHYEADYTNTFRELGNKEQPQTAFFSHPDVHHWYQQWQNRLKANNESLSAAMELMNATNPAVIPRNHKVNQALEAAINQNTKPLHALLEALANPYNDRPELKAYQLLPTADERVHQTFCGT